MYIKMEYIVAGLDELVTASQIVNDSELKAYKLWEPSVDIDDRHILYILSQSDDMDAVPPSKQGYNFLILNQNEVSAFGQECNVIVCQIPLEKIYAVINRIGDIFQSYNDWELKILNMLSQNASYQEFLDLGYEIIKYPMVMMDSNHNVLSITTCDAKTDILYYCMKHGYGKNFLNIINKSTPTLDEVASQSVIESTSPISMLRIRVKHLHGAHNQSFFIGLHKDDDQPFSTITVSLFDVFAQYLEKILQYKMDNVMQTSDCYSLLMERFLPQAGKDNQDVVVFLEDNKIESDGNWQLMGIKFNTHMRFRTDYHYDVMEEIKKILPDCHCALVYSYIVVLLKKPLDYEKYLAPLQYILLTQDAICAFSNPFFYLSDIKKIWAQILFMFSDEPHNDTDNIRYYSDYFIRHCLHMIEQAYPKELLQHSNFQKLKDFDEKNGASYLKTLRCYLENNCSMNVAADKLNIHRNSLQYRIHKIEELLGYEITNSDEKNYMLFSSLLMKNKEKL